MDGVWAPYGPGAGEQVTVGCQGKSSENPDVKAGHEGGECGRGGSNQGEMAGLGSGDCMPVVGKEPLEPGRERKPLGVLGGCVRDRILRT